MEYCLAIKGVKQLYKSSNAITQVCYMGESVKRYLL